MNTINHIVKNVTCEMRVTSVHVCSKKKIIFSGKPLKNHWVSSVKDISVVHLGHNNIPVEPMPGQQWKVKGTFGKKPRKHGDYILNEWHCHNPSLTLTLPHDGEAFVQFVAKTKEFVGIGEVKARELWRTFGSTLFKRLKTGDTEGLGTILSEQSVEALISGFAKYKNLDATNWLARHHIPLSVTQKLFEFHKEDSIQAIKENPYRLLCFGLSFDRADRISQAHFNVTEDDERRLIAAIQEALSNQVAKGHTKAELKDIKPTLVKLLGTPLAQKAMHVGTQHGAFHVMDGQYHPTAQYLMELVIAKRFRALLSQKNLFDEQANDAFITARNDLPYELTRKQTEAVLTALDNAITIITGGAGTGKTTVLKTVLNAFEHLGFGIYAVALSGRATMRLYESVKFETMTIARLLRGYPVPDGNNVLVIDEASMIDVPTMYRIITHISPDTRILLVGDKHQLPPIGCGIVLADSVNSQVIPTTELDIVKRQEGSTGIPEYSNLIRQGQIPDKLTTGKITFHDVLPERMNETIVSLYTEQPLASQIVCATYGAEHGGIDALNLLAQATCNPTGQLMQFEFDNELKYLNMRQDDPVLFTANNYHVGVQNGTLGRLTSVQQSENTFAVVTTDEGKDVEINTTLLNDLKLAYAISLHKAQGSQFPRVIVALNNSRLIDRSWLYTAITRAEIELHIVGTRQMFERAVNRQSAEYIRKTGLKTFLVDSCKNSVNSPKPKCSEIDQQKTLLKTA